MFGVGTGIVVGTGAGVAVGPVDAPRESAGNKSFCDSIGTLTAPRISVEAFRFRQSHGAMKAPFHKPARASRAAISSASYT